MKHIILIFIINMWSYTIYSMHNQNMVPWTWTYLKRFTPQEIIAHRSKPSLFFSKTGIHHFTQLLFSFNALRPKEGYYTFSVQVRNGNTGEWSSWHRMIDWGNAIQRSYTTKSDGWVQYFHVRLELASQDFADGFRIKVDAHDGADLSLMRGFGINICDSSKFTLSVTTKSLSNLPSVMVRGVPQRSQMVLDHPRAHEICSPTSMSMLVNYICEKDVDPVAFAHKSLDNGLGVYGSWPFNTAHAFEVSNGAVYFTVMRLNSFEELHSYLIQGIPVVVSIRGLIQGGAKPYPKGHLLVVVGWDALKHEVICHDPAFATDDQVLVRYPIEGVQGFLAAWGRSRNLAYIAQK